MSKVTLALGSFAQGVVSMFLASFWLPGNRNTIFAQSFMGPDSRPVVPVLSESVRVGGSVALGGAWRLDGINCNGCSFRNAELEYWGGPMRCINCLFDGKVAMEFKGAALNTLEVVVWFRKLDKERIRIPLPEISMQNTTIEKAIKTDIITTGTGK